MYLTLACLSFLGLAACQTDTPECTLPSTKVTPSHTLQYTPSMPEQIAPTSTVYGAMKITYMNVVDCNYAMVENIDSNPVQTGHFTAKTTVPFLNVYRMGCMPESTAVTRRGYQEYEMLAEKPPQTAVPDLLQHGATDLSKRATFESNVLNQVLSIAERLSSGIDPTNDGITLQDFKLMQQINTAMFALGVVNSGLPLKQACDQLRDPSIANNLNDNFVDPVQAADIVCFAAVNGIFFNMTNNQLLADLAHLEYAVQTHAYGTESLQEVCKTLDYSAASLLGVNTTMIQQEICNGTAGVNDPTSSSSSTATVPTGTGNSHPTATPLYPTSVPMSASGTSDGSGPSTSSIVFGSNGPAFSSATAAAGTVAPWFNTTASSMGAMTVTMDVLTMSETNGGASAETTTAAPNLFYNSPRLRRAELRRHGRGIF